MARPELKLIDDNTTYEQLKSRVKKAAMNEYFIVKRNGRYEVDGKALMHHVISLQPSSGYEASSISQQYRTEAAKIIENFGHLFEFQAQHDNKLRAPTGAEVISVSNSNKQVGKVRLGHGCDKEKISIK